MTGTAPSRQAHPPEPTRWAGHPVERATVGGMVVRSAGVGPPLMLLHGGFGSWNHWIRNVDALAAEYRLIVPDLPGMGGSVIDPPEDITIDDYLSLLDPVFGHYVGPSDRRLLLGGFSYGALLGSCLVETMADRIRAAALIAPGSYPAGAANRLPLMQIVNNLDDAEINAIHRHNLATLMIRDTAKIDDATVAMQRWNVENMRFSARMIGYGDHLGRYLPHTRCPILFLIGAHDPMHNPSSESRAAYLAAFSPLIKTEIVPDASHWAAFEQAEWVNARFLAFFRGAPP